MRRSTQPPDTVALLAAIIGGTTSLPGARCRGRAHLFDPAGLREPEDVTAERHRQALGLCERCPALPACRAWVDGLPPQQRPAGVVAGNTTERTHL